MSDFTLSKEKHIKYIIDNFDFNKVHIIMKSLNWSWAILGDIPSEENLKKEATRLLSDIYDSKNTISISTGGFKASTYNDHLELEFIICDFSSEAINYGKQYEKFKIKRNRKRKITKIEKIQRKLKLKSMKTIEKYEQMETEILQLLLKKYETLLENTELIIDKAKSMNENYDNFKRISDDYEIDIHLIRMELTKRTWEE